MKLGDYLDAHDIDLETFAAELHVSREAVRRYVIGARVPESRHLKRIAELTRFKVLPNDFFDLPMPCGAVAAGGGDSRQVAPEGSGASPRAAPGRRGR